MSKIQQIKESFKAIPKIVKQAKDYLTKKPEKVSKKKSEEKQVDINSSQQGKQVDTDRKTTNQQAKQADKDKKIDKAQPEETKQRYIIKEQREQAANQDTSKGSGRSRGDLGKMENASSSSPGKQKTDFEKGIKDVKDGEDIKTDLRQDQKEADKTYQETIGKKKIDEILEKGPAEKDKSWGGKYAPTSKMIPLL